MANLSKLDFQGKYNHSGTGLFKDNTSNDIEAVDVRALVTDTGDSFINRTDDVVDEDDMASNSAAKVPTQQSVKAYADSVSTTREFGRTFTSTLLFDKNMIEGELYVQDDDITFEVTEIGNLENQESIYGQRIVTDGIHPIYFSEFNHLANMASGDILEAGTYQFIFWYSNGIVRGSVMLPREETVMLTPLSVPANFAAVPGTDPDAELDLSWDAVTNADSYEIYRSTAGGAGPWGSAIATPGSGDTTYTDTGRSSNTTYHYRIRAISGGAPFANSAYVVTAATTTDAGDVTDPSFTSSPLDAATDIPVNQVVVITSDEAIQDADGVTEITNANILDYLTAVNSSAGAQSMTATIDATKKIITITPNVAWDDLEDITITLDGVEDLNGNEPAAFPITFTTSDYTQMQGNHMSMLNQINTYIVGADNNFEIEVELKDLLLSGSLGLFVKHATFAESLYIYLNNTDAFFKYYNRTGSSIVAREITWPAAFSGFTEGKVTFKYNGALDTNNGLDRPKLFIDDVEITSGKTISQADGAFPFDISGSSAAPFMLRGPALRQAKNFIFRTNMGATTVVNIPIIRTGIDISGNDFHGTWI